MPNVIYEKEGRIARIVLSRPGAGNAVNREMTQELEEICAGINGDNEVSVVVLGAEGVNFCTGSEPVPLEAGVRPAAAIAAIDRPVVVAVNGEAAGEGLEIALAGDIRLAAEDARFGLPQVSGGLIPADGGTQRLPRIVGKGKALEMLLTAETISAAEALELGLVSRVVPPGHLAEEAWKLAGEIAAKGPIALRYLKEAVTKGMDMTLEQGLRLEGDLYFLLHTTADRTEGIRAFLEKRPPKYEGK